MFSTIWIPISWLHGKWFRGTRWQLRRNVLRSMKQCTTPGGWLDSKINEFPSYLGLGPQIQVFADRLTPPGLGLGRFRGISSRPHHDGPQILCFKELLVPFVRISWSAAASWVLGWWAEASRWLALKLAWRHGGFHRRVKGSFISAQLWVGMYWECMSLFSYNNIWRIGWRGSQLIAFLCILYSLFFQNNWGNILTDRLVFISCLQSIQNWPCWWDAPSNWFYRSDFVKEPAEWLVAGEARWYIPLHLGYELIWWIISRLPTIYQLSGWLQGPRKNGT
jgi:hypothetical protein